MATICATIGDPGGPKAATRLNRPTNRRDCVFISTGRIVPSASLIAKVTRGGQEGVRGIARMCKEKVNNFLLSGLKSGAPLPISIESVAAGHRPAAAARP